MDGFTLIICFFQISFLKKRTAYIHSKSSSFMEPHTPATSQVTKYTENGDVTL